MKKIVTLALILSYFFSFSQSSSDSLNRPLGLNPFYAPWYVAINGESSKLYVKKKDSKRKKLIKKGAIAYIKTNEDTIQTLCKLLIFNDSGIYISPYQQKVITEIDNDNKYNLEYILLDSVKFISYNSIKSFKYKNNFEKKAWRNSLIFGTGVILLIIPPIIKGLNSDSKLFANPEDAIPMGLGALLTWYSIYNFKRNAKLEEINFNKSGFHYVLE